MHNIHIVHERPFSVALAKSYELGTKQGLYWTLCVDADVVMACGSISRLLTKAQKYPRKAFLFQGLVRDKLWEVREQQATIFIKQSISKKRCKWCLTIEKFCARRHMSYSK